MTLMIAGNMSGAATITVTVDDGHRRIKRRAGPLIS